MRLIAAIGFLLPKRAFLFLALVLCTPPVGSKTISLFSTPNPLGPYTLALIKLALSYSDTEYDILSISKEFSFARRVMETKENRISVLWGGAYLQKESGLQAIKIPIFKGLMGYRLFLISKSNKNAFSAIDRFSQLTKFTYGQGQGWADSAILSHNNLNVFEVDNYNNLFPMVAANRFDLLPRGSIEIWAELDNRPHLGLAVEKNVALYYPLPFYFYVNKDNIALENDLSRGLNAAILDKSFDNLFYNFPLIKEAIKKSRLNERKIFTLENPNFIGKNPFESEHYWHKPGE